jgi:hypothetical protein
MRRMVAAGYPWSKRPGRFQGFWWLLKVLKIQASELEALGVLGALPGEICEMEGPFQFHPARLAGEPRAAPALYSVCWVFTVGPGTV